MKTVKKFVPLVIALFIGFIIALQFRSFALVKERFSRDQNPNIFREVQILKGVTDALHKEKEELEAKKLEFSTRVSTAEALKREILTYQLLSGEIPVSGPGIIIIIPDAVSVPLLTDLMNELVTAGASALALNEERIGHAQAGMRIVSEKTLLLGDRVLRLPFKIEAIGSAKALSDAMLQPGSGLDRIEQALKNKPVLLTEEEKITMQPL